MTAEEEPAAGLYTGGGGHKWPGGVRDGVLWLAEATGRKAFVRFMGGALI